MSDISNSTTTSSKRRLNQIDDTIETLTQEYNTLNDFVYKTEFEICLMSVKMKREKLRALSAVARSQVLLTNMEVMIAESDLITDIERLTNFKRRKLNRNEDEPQVVTPNPPKVTPPPTTTTVSVQTTESMSNKKKKSRRSSSRKSPVDISSDETVIIPTIEKRIGSLGEPSQIYGTSFSRDLFTPTPVHKSDSEVSLSSSVKAEFNNPYTKTLTQESLKKSPAKKHRSEKTVKSKSKSRHATKHTHLPKTVADPRKSANIPPNHTDWSSRAASTPKDSKTGDKNSTAYATVKYAPVRHNMGVLPTDPRTSTMTSSRHPYLYYENPATQTNTPYDSQKASTSQCYHFYGSMP